MTRIQSHESSSPVTLDSEISKRRDLLAQWVDEHSDALYRFALARIDDEHTIEDLLQETFLAAIKAKDTFRGESSIRTWLIAILRLKIIDHYRRQSRSREVGSDVSLDQFAHQKPTTKWNCGDANTIEKEEFWGTLRSCLEKLPDTLSRAYLLIELDGNAPNFVCEMLKISQDNLAVRLFRARSALRDCLSKNWFTNS